MRHGIKAEKNYEVFRNRVDFMLAIAAEYDPDTLVLGVWVLEYLSKEQMNW